MKKKATKKIEKIVNPADHLVEGLKKRLGSRNVNALPKFRKVVINTGIGKLRKDKAKVEAVERDLTIITGQKPAPTQAKKSIATFTLRQGEKIGYKVTLRQKRMFDFLTRLAKIALPRTRDFQGLSDKSFDGQGNFTLGIKEQTIFPEINPEEAINLFGFEVVINTTATNNADAKALMEEFGFPFNKKG